MKKAIIPGILGTCLLIASAGAAMLGSPEGKAPDGPKKVLAGGSSVYAYLVYSEDYDISDGLYELTKSGANMKWKAPSSKYDLNAGWLKDGKICGYAEDRYGYQLRGMIYEEIDFSTGKLNSSVDIDLNGAYFTIATLNFSDNTIYGYGKDVDGKYAFMKAPLSSPTTLEKVKNVDKEECFTSICYNPVDQKIYGVTVDYNTALVTVDVNGTQSTVMTMSSSIDANPDYITGLVWSPVENLFYWNKYEGEESYTSALCTIDPVAKTVKTIKNYNNEEQFSVYFTTDRFVVAGEPASPLSPEVSFPDGALSGTFSFTLPSKDIDGNDLSGSLSWTALIDDVTYKTGNGTTGEKIAVDVTSLTEGNHTFSAYAEVNGIKGEASFVNSYIGNDTPMAPANVELTQGGISWDAVTEGVNGGYVDLSALRYEVFVDGVSKGETASNSMKGILPTQGSLAWYQASVVAKAGGKSSAPALSNKTLAGSPLEMPVELTPTKDEFALMQTFDLDGDSYSWKCRDGYMESQWSLSKDGGNDWVVLPPVAFPDPSAVYSLAFQAMRKMTQTGRESLEVRIGTSPEPMNMERVLIEDFEPLTDFTGYGAEFKVPEAGTYYIAFHATSMKWEAGIENGMEVRDIKIQKSGLGDSSPGAVTDLVAVGAEKGVLEATVSFVMPVLTYGGEPLEAEEVTATVTAENSVTVKGAPGSKQSVTVKTRQGQNVVNVVTSCGETAGTSSKIEVYTGVVVPGMVENLEFVISEDMLSVEMKWDAPTEGVTPGYVDPATTKYRIYEAVQSFYDMTWELRGVTEPGVTTFTYSVEAGKQKSHTLVVMAENVAGFCDDMAGGEVLLGMPHAMPMFDDFENGRDYFQYEPWIKYQPDEFTTGYWSVWPAENVIKDGEGNALIGKPTEAGGKGCMGLPAVRSNEPGVNVELEFDVMLNSNTPKMTVTGLCYGMAEPVVIGTLPEGDSDAPVKVRFTLPEAFSAGGWIQLYFNVEYTKSTQLLIIDNVKVSNASGSVVSDGLSALFTVSGSKGSIELRGAVESVPCVYDIEGKLICKLDAYDGAESVQVAPGIYVVKAGKHVHKVAVR